MTAPNHAWLRRLSDYHSGGVAENERVAVEDHLATCAECQEALAMYRRLYTLLRSPLRLGGPSAGFDESTVPLSTSTRPTAPANWSTSPRPPRKRRALAGLAAALAAVLIIAGFVAVIGSRVHPPSIASTPRPQPSATARPTSTALPTATPQPTSTTAPLAWSQYNGAGAVQIWIAASGGSPRLLATIPTAGPTTGGQQCPLVSAGPPMTSPDRGHILVGLGQQCNGFILDPGPLAILDAASGHLSYVPLPAGATVLPQARSYGWVDNQTLFAIAYDATHAFKGAFLYTLGAASAAALQGLQQTPLDGAVRGSTLFYLAVGSGAGGIESSLRRYDLTRHAPLTGSISLGAYTACSECPDMVSSPGWDVTSNGSHVVYQFTTPKAGGGIASSQIFYASADGSSARQIAQYLATDSFVHLRLAPDGARVAITAAYPLPTVVTACVGSPGAKGDPCFVTYTPDAISVAAWTPDGKSFVAATVDASYGQPSGQTGALIRYILGESTGRLFITGGYSPWSSPESTTS